MTTDISHDSREVQRGVFARMTGAQRVEAAVDMSEAAKQIAIEGIRSRHPEFNELQVKRAWFVILHGEERTDEVLGPRLIDN